MDDFFMPDLAAEVVASARRSQTPTPAKNHKTLAEDERRAKSAPRAEQRTPLAAERLRCQDFRNGDTVFCFQPGNPGTAKQSTRRDAGINDKKSVSRFQHEQKMHQLIRNGANDSGTRHQQPTDFPKLRDHVILREPSFLSSDVDIDYHMDSGTGFLVNDMQCRDSQSQKHQPIPSSSFKQSTNPRQYAANYYASKLAPQKATDNKSRTKSAETKDGPSVRGCVQTSIRTGRTISEQMAECLLLTSDLYQGDRGKKYRNGRRHEEDNSFFFFNDPEDATFGTIETDEVTDDFDNSTLISTSVDKTTLQNTSEESRTKEKRHAERRNERKNRGRQRCREADITSTVCTTSSSSSCEERQRRRGTRNTRSASSSSSSQRNAKEDLLRPPKILNMKRRIEVEVTPTSVVQVNPGNLEDMMQRRIEPDIPSTPLVQVNPDDLEDFSRRNKDTRPSDLDPLLPPRPQRDFQRRPRGMYERTVSEDDGSRGSRPYDETPSLGAAALETGQQQPNLNHRSDQTLCRGEGTIYSAKQEEISANYATALQDLAYQEKLLQNLMVQLKGSRLALETSKRDLQQSKAESAKRSQVFEETTSKIFRERIEIDEQLRKELQAKQNFKDQVANLKKDVARLTAVLEKRTQEPRFMESTTQTLDNVGMTSSKADPQAPRADTPNARNVSVVMAIDLDDIAGAIEVQDTEATEAVNRLSANLLALQAELVDLRAQLAEAHAANLSSNIGMEQLKRDRYEALEQVSSLSHELSRLKTESEEIRSKVDLSSQRDDDETARLKEQLHSLQQELATSNQHAAQFAAKNERLEQELADVLVEAKKFEFQATSLDKTLQKARADSSDMARVGDSEVWRLQNDLKEMKEKLSQRNSEIIRQAAVHLKERKRMEEEYEAKLQQALNIFQHQVARNTDTDVVISEWEAPYHERQNEIYGVRKSGNRGSSVKMNMFRHQGAPNTDHGVAFTESDEPPQDKPNEHEGFHRAVNMGSSVFMNILRKKLDLK